jgi:hypothetical protein
MDSRTTLESEFLKYHHINQSLDQTLGSDPESATLPRIRFKFRIPYGQSFRMTRVQFPLRLAYCMTYNKSQGQTLQRVLLDVSNPPFAHGHLYVALSRVTNYSDIKSFVGRTNHTTTLQRYGIQLTLIFSVDNFGIGER